MGFPTFYSKMTGSLDFFDLLRKTFQKYGLPVFGSILLSGASLKNGLSSFNLLHLPPLISGSTYMSTKWMKHIWNSLPFFSIGTICTFSTQSHLNRPLNTRVTFSSVTKGSKYGMQYDGIDMIYYELNL